MFDISHGNPYESEQECMLIGLLDQPKKFTEGLQQLDDAFQGKLTELVKTGDISAKYKSVTVLHSLGNAPVKRFIFLGLGKEKELTVERLREGIGKASKKLKDLRVKSFAIALDTLIAGDISSEEAAWATSEAYTMASYEFAGYRKKSNEPEVFIDTVTVFTNEDRKKIDSAVKTGWTFGIGVNHARTLVNKPSNLLRPADLAAYAAELADEYGFEIEILEKEEMEKLGMGAFLAVNQGSEESPFMIVLKYQGKADWTDVLGLVGKGITFDTGGYSIKPKDGIVGMKTDMGGAASVLGAMEIIGRIKPKRNVVAVIPATDNVISEKAFKPDDVITSMNGKTIEVLNTDAEGRLVLADAITYAKMHGADRLVDVATLTGGVIIALGLDKTGAITNNEEFYREVKEVSNKTGEFIWLLPYTENDKKRVRSSKIADLNNSPGREGHAIMGGAFIGEFVESTPWVHLDIAGTATTDRENDLGPSGATGVMVRTLAMLAIGENTQK